MKRHLPPDFPTRIKRLRVKFGLTQTRLAELMGISFASVDNPPTIDFSADGGARYLVAEVEI